MTIYAIGDIHGQLEKLTDAHDLIAKDRIAAGADDALVVHLGDLTDRGPNSRGVLDFLISGIAAGQPWMSIKGNHDRMFAGFMRDADHHDPGLRASLSWLDPRLGGNTTLRSYGVTKSLLQSHRAFHTEAVSAVPEAHIAFLEELPVCHQTKDVFFAHAGIRPGVPFNEQLENDLLWIRDGFLDNDDDHGALIVHGHTPVKTPTHLGNRINLDTGAGYGHALTAAVFEGPDCFILGKNGRTPLHPDPQV